MHSWIHPAAILILGSVFIPLFKGRVKKVYLLLLPALAFLSVLNMSEGTYGVYHLLGQEITFGRVDKLSLVFGYVFSIAAFAGMLYGLHLKDDWHHIAALVYAGGALGVTFAGDYLSLFVFWEFMAFSSVFLVLLRRTPDSYDAAYRYVLVHVFGGVCLLGGIILQHTHTGSFEFDLINFGGPAVALILIGFIVNAAVPPFNAWLPDAYPRATIVGAVFLSAFTTKRAVYVLARGFAGTDLLILLGVIMALYGVIYAMLENDIRRVQAYSIISQVGYMVAGVGIGTELAINGVVAHAFAHILYKGLLFMGTGAIIYMTGRSKMTELGGLYKAMPLTFIFYMVGAFAISAFPLFSGFVSKSVILSAAAEEHLSIEWILLTMAAAGTFLYTGLKLPYLVFIKGETRTEAGKEAADPPTNMLLAMGLAAFLCVFFGIFPGVLYHMLPHEFHYVPYTAEHIVWSLEILLFTALGFYLFKEKLIAVPTITIDTDWFYRMGGRAFMWISDRAIAAADNVVGNAYKTLVLTPSIRTASGSVKFDLGIIDGIVNGVANVVLNLSSRMRQIQTGQLQHYAVAILVGLLVFLNVVLFLS
jgi:multicomponent Na+:H+ antiporter subunit D